LAERLYELLVARDDVYGVETDEGWRTERGKLTVAFEWENYASEEIDEWKKKFEELLKEVEP
jgi:hypothetical protein